MKKIFFSILIMSISVLTFGQEKGKSNKEVKREIRKERVTVLVKQEEEGIINYRKSFLGGIKLTSDGYGGFIEMGRA
ncbi:MAG: hypothetical protein LH615_06310, partial [Ferruginibacter sp.]|nr:hypothetical protein [Ferruginibacter sp.]